MVLLSNEQVCMFTLQILICAIYTVIGCLRFKRMNSRGVMNSMQNTGFYLITRYFSGGAGRDVNLVCGPTSGKYGHGFNSHCLALEITDN